VSEDYFRPRVPPSHDPAQPEPWPGQTDETPPEPEPDPEEAAPGDEDLLSSFDVVRRELDASRVADGEVQPPAAAEPVAAAKPAKPARRTRPPTVAPKSEPVTTPPAPQVPVSRAAAPPPDTTVDTVISRQEREPQHPGHRRAAALTVAGVLIVCGGVVAVVATHKHSAAQATASAPSAPVTATPDDVLAVTWMVGAVGAIGPTHVVACDVSVCALLHARGFPSSSLITVTSGLSDVEQADTIVLTPVLRDQLGAGVDAIVSAEPLAVFWSGAARVEVAAVALDGADNYKQSLAVDRANRRTAGLALLDDRNLTVDAQARAVLAAGLVDTRVCALLALLTGTHTVVLAGFTPVTAGAGPDIPSAGVVVESIDGQPATGTNPKAAQLLSVVHAQQAPYLAMSATPGTLDGHRGLQIVFSQPGELGLLGGAAL
jgi:hypothetical protein